MLFATSAKAVVHVCAEANIVLHVLQCARCFLIRTVCLQTLHNSVVLNCVANLVCKFARLALPCVADLVGCKLSSAHSQFCACECPILVLQVCNDGLQQVQDLLCNFARLVRTFINLGSIFAPCVLHELANLVLQVAH